MDSRASLDLARANFRRAKTEERQDLPHAGGRWDIYCSNARSQIESFSSPAEVIAHAQLRGGFETRHTGDELAAYATAMIALCRETFPQYAEWMPTFTESPVSVASTTMDVGGRRVSSPLLYHTRVIMRLIALCSPQTVVEIGGGTGAPARTWMTNGLHRPRLYVNIDFPESLFYAETFLREALPERRLTYLHRGMSIGTDDEIVLCPVSNIDQVLPLDADIAVNTGSLQEMSDEYVAFYMAALDRSNWKRFFSCNYFGQPLQDLQESMNCGAPVMSAQWRTIFLHSWPHALPPTAEMAFERGMAEVNPSVADSPPKNVDDLLRLFDAVRASRDPEVLIAAAQAMIAGMPYVPKEALCLARLAKPQDETGRKLLAGLEEAAAAADVHRAQQHGTLGAVHAETIEIGGESYKITDTPGGAAEYFMRLEAGVDTAGWAGDMYRNRPVASVIACVDKVVVARTVPIGDRPDIEHGYGPGIKPAKFSLRVPLRPGGDGKIEFYALTEDGRAVRIQAP